MNGPCFAKMLQEGTKIWEPRHHCKSRHPPSVHRYQNSFSHMKTKTRGMQNGTLAFVLRGVGEVGIILFSKTLTLGRRSTYHVDNLSNCDDKTFLSGDRPTCDILERGCMMCVTAN